MIRINLKKLAEMGFESTYNRKENDIVIWPKEIDQITSEKVMQLADWLDFEGRETDELISAINKLIVMNAIRRASTF